MVSRSTAVTMLKLLLWILATLFTLGGLCDEDYSNSPDPLRVCTETQMGTFCE